MAAKQRLFFALWPEDSARLAAEAAIQRLRPLLAARWVRPENLHVTLAFLGDVADERLGALRAAADSVQASGFTLSLDTLEHWRKPQILCLSPFAAAPPLERLAADLSGRLRAAGFALDDRPFRAHLTLARSAAYVPADARLEQPILWPAGRFVLVASTQDHLGSHYAILRAWPLHTPGD